MRTVTTVVLLSCLPAASAQIHIWQPPGELVGCATSMHPPQPCSGCVEHSVEEGCFCDVWLEPDVCNDNPINCIKASPGGPCDPNLPAGEVW
jgi:hypothetical protein